jgi:hypothetical protein
VILTIGGVISEVDPPDLVFCVLKKPVDEIELLCKNADDAVRGILLKLCRLSGET